MIPHSLKLKNFTGIRAGLGVDEIYIDLDAVAGDESLVALKGSNGKGKSTILDNLHPFRLMPSRATSYSPRSFSYYDNTFDDAEKVLEWSHDSERYRSTILIKGGGKSKKTEAYLHQRLDEWVPVSLPDGTSSDGKADTYDRCIEHILGTPDMFFTAVFAAQNRTPLSAYKNGEIKALMSELLGLDHITDQGGKAGEVVKLLTARQNGCKQQLVQVTRQQEDRDRADQELATARTTLRLQTSAKTEVQAKVRELTQELAIAQANAGNLESIEKQRRDISEDIDAARQACDTRVADMRAGLDREQQALYRLNRGHEDQLGDLDKRIETAGARYNQHQALLEQSESILAATARVDDLVNQEARIGAELTEMDNTRAEVEALSNQRNAVRVEFEGLKHQGQQLAGDLEQARRQSQLADEVPCTGTDLQPKCKLLHDAMEAREKIPGMETDLTEKRGACEACRDQDAGLTQQIEAFGDISTMIQAKRAQHADIRQELERVRTLAMKADQLAQAETDADLADREVAELKQQRAAAQVTADEERAAITQRINDIGQQIASIQEESRAAIENLQEKLAQLDAQDHGSAVTAAQQALDDAEQKLAELDAGMAEKQNQVARLEAEVENLNKAIIAGVETRKTLDRIESELSQWRLLQSALGPDGIVALSIDDAGPTLASLTNDLLLSAYGPRFTVSISTQAQTQAGTDKETFDVLVFDGERDEQKSVRSMSGGERIWINECLTRAIALYQAQQSGQSYGCLFADESDGALDQERKEMFVRMKRKVMELGGYEREFFISHTPALWDLADAVIDVESLV